MTGVDPHIAIRPLRAADLDQIFNPATRPYGEKWLKRQERAEVHVAVAELEGVPVGRAGVDFVKQQDGATALLWAAHVEPGYQSRGIGTALCLHLERVALRRSFTVMKLNVGKENGRARRLYERLGYSISGEEIARWSYREGDRVVEVAEDCWTMRKRLKG